MSKKVSSVPPLNEDSSDTSRSNPGQRYRSAVAEITSDESNSQSAQGVPAPLASEDSSLASESISRSNTGISYSDLSLLGGSESSTSHRWAENIVGLENPVISLHLPQLPYQSQRAKSDQNLLSIIPSIADVPVTVSFSNPDLPGPSGIERSSGASELFVQPDDESLSSEDQNEATVETCYLLALKAMEKGGKYKKKKGLFTSKGTAIIKTTEKGENYEKGRSTSEGSAVAAVRKNRFRAMFHHKRRATVPQESHQVAEHPIPSNDKFERDVPSGHSSPFKTGFHFPRWRTKGDKTNKTDKTDKTLPGEKKLSIAKRCQKFFSPTKIYKRDVDSHFSEKSSSPGGQTESEYLSSENAQTSPERDQNMETDQIRLVPESSEAQDAEASCSIQGVSHSAGESSAQDSEIGSSAQGARASSSDEAENSSKWQGTVKISKSSDNETTSQDEQSQQRKTRSKKK